jgi:uncharacterized HAD superfamily protein
VRLGVDIDNTLNDISQSIARELDPLVGMDTEEKLKEHLWISKAVGWTEEQVEDFFSLRAEKIHQLASLKDEYVLSMLKGLYMRGVRFTVITNRNPKRTGYDIIHCTHDWLEREKVMPFIDDIEFVESCKHTYCKENDIHLDAMVEDNPERALAFAEGGTKVILLDFPYNRHIEHPNVHRVSDWWGVYQEVVNLQNEMGRIL